MDGFIKKMWHMAIATFEISKWPRLECRTLNLFNRNVIRILKSDKNIFFLKHSIHMAKAEAFKTGTCDELHISDCGVHIR